MRWEGSWAPNRRCWQLARAKNRRKVTIDFALVGVNDSEGQFVLKGDEGGRYSPLNKGFPVDGRIWEISHRLGWVNLCKCEKRDFRRGIHDKRQNARLRVCNTNKFNGLAKIARVIANQ